MITRLARIDTAVAFGKRYDLTSELMPGTTTPIGSVEGPLRPGIEKPERHTCKVFA